MNNILLGAELSRLAYLSSGDAAIGALTFGSNNFEWIDCKKSNCQAFICADDDQVFVVIRGTEFEVWEDWQTNLDCEFVESEFGLVHKGFKTDAESIYIEVTGHLLKHTIQHKLINIVGHSQGAAVAKQLGILLLESHMNLNVVIGYGEPRNVHYETADMLDTTFPGLFHRVANNSDLVTRVPLRIMGYKHYGQLHYFKEDGEYTTDISFWRRFLDRMVGRVSDLGQPGLDTIKDHDINEYIGCLSHEFIS